MKPQNDDRKPRNPSDWESGDVIWTKAAGQDIKPSNMHPNSSKAANKAKRVDLLRAVLKARRSK